MMGGKSRTVDRWQMAVLGIVVLSAVGCEARSVLPAASPLPVPLRVAATDTPIATASPASHNRVERLQPVILAIYPHDTTAFTEGLVMDESILYESTGQYGASTLRKVDLETGQVLESVTLPPSYFGEGLALVNTELIQLTWHEETAFTYDVETLAKRNEVKYQGEGWGLCFDGEQLYMSDGSSTLTLRDPVSLNVESSMIVLLDGMPVSMLNELECVDDVIYANVWHTNNILRIDKETGRVTGVIDASGLLTPEEIASAGHEGVSNGIAYDPQHGTFLLTGKLWPKLFEVRFEIIGS